MYEKYNLKKNPFTDITYGYPMIDRFKTENDLKKALSSFIGSKNPAIQPLVGDYGVGKTFFLKRIEDKINDEKFFDDKKEKTIASYITAILPKSPSSYIQYIYSEFTKRIGFENFKKLVFDLYKLKNKEELLEEFDRDFRNALMNFKNNEGIAWEYICAGTVSRSEAKDIDIKHSIRDDRQSLIAFVNLLKFLYIINCKSVILLIDEFEYLFARGSQQGAQFLNTFRFLYDRTLERLSDKGDIANPIFISACSPIIWDQILKDAEKNVLGTKPFIDRALDEITLPPFSEEETKDFMVGRLENYRIDKTDKDRTGPYPFIDKEKNNPFELITKINRGLPRLILKNTATIIEKAYEKDFKIIGFEEVETLGKELGLISKEEIRKDKNLFQI